MTERFFDHVLEWGVAGAALEATPDDWRQWPAQILAGIAQGDEPTARGVDRLGEGRRPGHQRFLAARSCTTTVTAMSISPAEAGWNSPASIGDFGSCLIR